MEKYFNNSKNSFKKPKQLVDYERHNKQIYSKLIKMMKEKPSLYTDNPIDTVKWAEKLVNLYKSLK